MGYSLNYPLVALCTGYPQINACHNYKKWAVGVSSPSKATPEDMPTCPHVTWLHLRQEKSCYNVEYSDRLDYLAESLPNSSRQYPSTVLFIGKTSKSKALRALYQNPITSKRTASVADITIDGTTTHHQYPLLVASCDVEYSQKPSSGSKDGCHETTSHLLTCPHLVSGDRQEKQILDYVYSRLVFPFLDVMCLFAHDYGGLNSVADQLCRWADTGSASSLPRTVRPRVIVVANVVGPDLEAQIQGLRLKVLSHPMFFDSFSSLSVLNVLKQRRHASQSYFSALSQLLKNEVQVHRQERSRTDTLFSMTHICAFFRGALNHFTRRPMESFNFLDTARAAYPVAPHFQHHMESFVDVCSRAQVPKHILPASIASAIMIDAYPPDMHLFHHSVVFRHLYRNACSYGVQNFVDKQGLSCSDFCAEIESHLGSMVRQMRDNGSSAAFLRLRNFSISREHWKLVVLPLSCIGCLQRAPAHSLECGHALCDVCICIFGTPTSGREFHYDLFACPICGANITCQARLVPPTCRVRFLGVDGGGSRGVVSLGFLKELERSLNLPYSLQEHFDFAIGTSSGGLVVLALFAKYWTPDKCLEFFRSFAQRVFAPRAPAPRSLCAKIARFFSSYFADGRYDAGILERYLKAAFGTRPLFSPAEAQPSGMRYVVTATTISDATLCLISNYCHDGRRTVNPDKSQASSHTSGYKHLQPRSSTGEILLWEAARCTTAAPTFFKPKHLGSFGTFQDGGLRNNNPVRPGLREVRRIWNEGDCDLVLSVGNGFQQKLFSPVASHMRNLFQDGALLRIYRAFMESLSLHGQNSWDDHYHGLDEEARKRHYRLNLPLHGKEPDIDDVGMMQSLSDEVAYNLGDVDGIARAFIAVSFFFELDGPLVRDGAYYTCYGSVLSRSPNSQALIQRLNASYPYTTFSNHGKSLGYVQKDDVCKLCGLYRKPVVFRVRQYSEQINIQLVFNRLYQQGISGMPHAVEWFADRQHLHAVFGQATHKSNVHRHAASECACQVSRHEAVMQSALQVNKRPLSLRRSTRRKRIRLSA